MYSSGIYDNIPTRQFSDATIFRNQRSRQYSDATIFRCDNFPTKIFRRQFSNMIFGGKYFFDFLYVSVQSYYFIEKKLSRREIFRNIASEFYRRRIFRNFVASEFCPVGILSSEYCLIGILSHRNFPMPPSMAIRSLMVVTAN